MITVKDNFLTRMFRRGAASSLSSSYATMLNNLAIADFDNATKAVEMFRDSDIIYSIVSKKAQTGARAPFGVYRIKSNGALKKYIEYQHQKDLNRGMLLELKESAIEPIGHYLNEKYQHPNPDQSASEYTELLITYLNLTGDAFEQAIRKNKRGDILQFFAMPADLVQIKTDGNYPIVETGYRLPFVRDIDFTRDEVIHSKYANPRWSQDGQHLYGLSPIQAGFNLINGDNEGWDAMWQMKKNRGSRKVAGIKNDKISNYLEGKEMMEGLKGEFSNRDREFRDRVMPIWGEISIHDVGISAKDMEIMETAQLTFERICNLFHVPVEWFNTTKESKYSNLEQYNKQAIINGVMPDLNRLRDSRNAWARSTNVIRDNEMIDYDQSVFSELEVDRKSMMEWLKDSPFSPNEARVFMGENPIKNENMDQVYISRNKVSIDKVNDLKNEQANQGNSGGDQGDQTGKGI
ncbi:MAG: phage portal protein [Niabella sp.]|nr:phage portal protein [Niabella sp.]